VEVDELLLPERELEFELLPELELPPELEPELEPELLPELEPPFFATARSAPRVMTAVSAHVMRAPAVVVRSKVKSLKDGMGFSDG
jgi:hypothetical protein